MPLRGNKLKRITSPRVTLGSSKNSGSWLVARKNLPSYKNRYGQISQRAAQGSLYRGAGRQRRSERLKGSPYAQGRWPCIFLRSAGPRRPANCAHFISLSRRNAASVGAAQSVLTRQRFPKRMAWRAARYALRVSRSVVVSLSLSRRSRT